MKLPHGAPYWVELSGENLVLADRELAACVAVVDPHASAPSPVPGLPAFREVGLRGTGEARELARRMAYAHRVVLPLAEGPVDLLAEAIQMHGATGETCRVRVAGGAPGDLAATLPPYLGHAFVSGGGRVDLERPERDFFVIVTDAQVAPSPGATEGMLTEVIGEVPRSEVEAHRAKHRVYRKPITLPPRLARGLVNLARAPRGGRVLDPFCGTGAILIEAGHLGYRTVGADLESEMVQGALRNLTGAGVVPETMIQCGVAELPDHLRGASGFDAVVCDPPYGRSATTGGQGSLEVLRATLRALPRLLRPGARAVLLLSQPTLPVALPSDLTEEDRFEAQRVHRSLTRHVVVLRRGPPERRAAYPT